MQIGGEGIENLLIHMVLEKKKLAKSKPKNTPLCAYLFWNGINKF